jgi:hypothetical protein
MRAVVAVLVELHSDIKMEQLKKEPIAQKVCFTQCIDIVLLLVAAVVARSLVS